MPKLAFHFDNGIVNSETRRGGGASRNKFSCLGDVFGGTGSLAAVTAPQLDVELVNMLAVASIALAQLTLQTSTLILHTSHEVGSIHQTDLLSYTVKTRDVVDEMRISQQQQFKDDSQR